MDSNQIREFALNPVCSADTALHYLQPPPSSLQQTHIHSILVGCKHRASEVLLYIGGRGLVSQIIEPVTFARCAFIIALRNIALDGYLDTRRNI